MYWFKAINTKLANEQKLTISEQQQHNSAKRYVYHAASVFFYIQSFFGPGIICGPGTSIKTLRAVTKGRGSCCRRGQRSVRRGCRWSVRRTSYAAQRFLVLD